MGNSSPLSPDERMVGMLQRLPPIRMSTRDLRPGAGPDTALLGTTSFYGDSAYDVAGKFLGEIEELVLDIRSGRIAYALMSIGGFLGMGRKMVAVPWTTVTIDRVYQRCVINVDLGRLIDAPSLDEDPLPHGPDASWAAKVHAFFGCKPYWE
jgi:sporulation protein YlmC with PRC-barrel domain